MDPRRTLSALVEEAARLAGELGVAPEEATHCARAIEALFVALGVDAGPARFAVDPEQDCYGRFVEPKLIAKGGMGAILRVHDPALDRALAIKVLLPEAASSRSRFLTEARITSQLEHPSIVPVHEIGTSAAGMDYLCMKLVRGKTLDEALDCATTRDRAALLRDFLKICDGVALAHSRGVIHRDLKPSNIMLGEFGEVLVLDWGIATTRDAEGQRPCRDPAEADAGETLDGEVLGTPAYMSPEQARGEVGRVGVASDIYGLGGILYTMLAGEPPYAGPVEQVLAQVRAGELVLPSRRVPERRVPRELDAVVARAMAHEPEARFSDVAALRADVEAFLDGRTLDSLTYAPWQVLAKWIARHRAASGVAAVAALLLLAVTAFFVVRLDARRRDAERAARAERELRHQVEERARRDGELLLLRRLRDEAERLWPPLPEQLPALRAWLARAETLHELRPEAAPLAVEIARRIARAERVGRQSAAADWSKAGIPPQSGLVPLGPDPASGLQEFCHLLSGEPPPRGPDDRLRRSAESGLVLVLVPAGTLQMGAATGGWQPDPFARPEEGPVHPVRLPAFLIAKHELSVGQWRRITGERRPQDERMPLALVDWQTARRALLFAGLRLPSEAEWEWAARGGTRSTWWTGQNVLRLTGAANLADQALQRAGRGAAHESWLDDGHAGPAPPGSFRANGYGLHDVAGNLREWVADTPAPYGGPPDPTARWYRVQRGGSYLELAVEARSARRRRAAPQAASPLVGLRPARALGGP